MRTEKFYPLNELHAMDIPRVNWNLALPEYAPAHKIGVNVLALSRFARLGGYETLAIDGAAMGVAQTRPRPDSINSDGSITSSGVSNTTAPTSRV